MRGAHRWSCHHRRHRYWRTFDQHWPQQTGKTSCSFEICSDPVVAPSLFGSSNSCKSSRWDIFPVSNTSSYCHVMYLRHQNEEFIIVIHLVFCVHLKSSSLKKCSLTNQMALRRWNNPWFIPDWGNLLWKPVEHINTQNQHKCSWAKAFYGNEGSLD